jgi:hypothetical protein
VRTQVTSQVRSAVDVKQGTQCDRGTRSILFALLFAIFPEVAKADDNSGGVAALLILGILLFLIYFLPTIVAFNKRHPNRWVILVLNTFLGSTGIVWIISLIWALKAVHISEDSASYGKSGGGESGLNIFANDEKRVRIVNQTGGAPRVAGPGEPNIATQILRIKELLDGGAITKAEFDELKRRIISGK